MAQHSLTSEDRTSEYVVSTYYLRNGVVKPLTHTYGPFTLNQAKTVRRRLMTKNRQRGIEPGEKYWAAVNRLEV